MYFISVWSDWFLGEKFILDFTCHAGGSACCSSALFFVPTCVQSSDWVGIVLHFFFAGFHHTCSSRINSESFQAQIGFMIVLSLHWLYLQHNNDSEFQLYFDIVHEGRQRIPKNQVKFAMAWVLMCTFQYFSEALLIAVGQDLCY